MYQPQKQAYMEDELLESIQVEPGETSIIKVMGVGGGGCNAVNYLYRIGVTDVSFLVCNTDRRALLKSPITSRLQLGPGRGAGGRPEKAEEFANESREQIKEALSDGTEMLFIAAGMGGGTGTGASPVVAEVAQELGILTVAIVTIPFAFEGKKIIRKALRGVAKLAEHVDAILVINNERLRIICPDFDLPNAFDKSDEVVSNAAKSIAEIITVPGYINTDFQDVYNTLKDGGVAIMNVGKSTDPELRIPRAIQDALNSPLVNTTDVKGASRILLTFYCSRENAIRMQELDQINNFIDAVGDEVEVKWGASYDETLGDEVRVTVIATGYQVSDIPGIEQCEEPLPVVVEMEKKSIEDAMKHFYSNDSQPEEEPAKAEEEQEEQPAEESVQEEMPAEEVVEDTVEEEPAEASAEEEVIEDLEAEAAPAPEAPKPNNVINFEGSDFTFDLDEETENQIDNTPAWMRRR